MSAIDDQLEDPDRCLLRSSALLALSQPDAAGYLHRRANLSGWYRYWFSLHGSQLYYYDVATDDRRGLLQGTISMFRNQLTVVSSSKRPREFDLVDFHAKAHTLRAESDAQLHWWIQVFAIARNKIPPAKPFKPVQLLVSSSLTDLLQPNQISSVQTDSATFGNQSAANLSRRAGSTSSLIDPNRSQNVSEDIKSSGAQGPSRNVPPLAHVHSLNASQVNGTTATSATAPPSPNSSSAAPTELFVAPLSSTVSGSPSTAAELAFSEKTRPPQVVSNATAGGDSSAIRQSQSSLTRTIPASFVEDHLPVDHVLCVVHGIGASEDVLADNIRMLQDSYADIATKVFPDLNFRVELLIVRWRNALTKLDVHKKLQAVVPIAPSMSGESNPLRQFMVHRIVDYVYYTHDRYRKHILREVVAQLNDQMKDLRQRRPDFHGHVSIFAHSLGAALCYELLCRKVYDDRALLAAEGLLLDFDVANLFMAGSPLGTFLHLDQSLAYGADIRDLPFRLYNIFHPNDPIATRIEPYIESRFAGVHPIVVPYWCNMGTRSSTTQWLGTLWSGTTAKKTNASSVVTSGRKSESAPGLDSDGKAGARTPKHSAIGLNGLSDDSTNSTDGVKLESMPTNPSSSVQQWENLTIHPSAAQVGIGTATSEYALAATLASDTEGDAAVAQYFPQAAQDEVIACASLEHRFDFVLQLSSTIEEVSTSWSALRAHTDYWSNRDLMLLILSSMLKTSHGIPDDVSRYPAPEVDSHVIDSRIHLKANQFGLDWPDNRNKGIDLSGLNQSACVPQSLNSAVEQYVEKLMDETVAMNDLMLQHPHVRMRGGGITRSDSVGPYSKPAAVSEKSSASYSGWTSYIPWFGKENDDNAGASKSKPQDRGDGPDTTISRGLNSGATP